jgi:hypothetical protein
MANKAKEIIDLCNVVKTIELLDDCASSIKLALVAH